MPLEIDEEKLTPLGRATFRMGVLACGLTEDRGWIAIHVDAEMDEFGSARRAYVRVMLSFIEGMNHALKQILIAAAECHRVNLSDEEVQILRGVQIQLDGKYKPKVVHRPLRVKDDVRFTLLMLGKCADAPFDPNFGDQGWAAFLDAIAIRNRVTHPKSRDDLWLTDADLVRVDQAVKWFEDETG